MTGSQNDRAIRCVDGVEADRARAAAGNDDLDSAGHVLGGGCRCDLRRGEFDSDALPDNLPANLVIALVCSSSAPFHGTTTVLVGTSTYHPWTPPAPFPVRPAFELLHDVVETRGAVVDSLGASSTLRTTASLAASRLVTTRFPSASR